MPALGVLVETQAGEGRDEMPVAKGEEIRAEDDALAQRAALAKAEAFGEGIVAVEQFFEVFGRHTGLEQAGVFRLFALLCGSFLALAGEQHVRAG
ncbi:hypothetical protein D3C78_821940 [compost metagenome]